MPESGRFFLLLVVALLAELSLGAVNITKSACLGDSIELFQDIKVASSNTVLSIYINGNNHTLIAMWTMQNSVLIPTFMNGYSERLFLDKSGNIWIYNIRESDEHNYVIKCCTIGNFTMNEVQLRVLVPPERHCKPKIIREADTLKTDLEVDGCGKPAASAYFLDESGVSHARNEIKLQPGQEAGTVYACINSPAMRCAKSLNLYDYCTVFKDENRIQSKLSESSSLTTDTIAILTCVIGMGFAVITTIIVVYFRLKRLRPMTARDYRTDIVLASSADQSIDTGVFL